MSEFNFRWKHTAKTRYSWKLAPVAFDVTADLGRVSEQSGDVIGKYKLLQQIGEGGFGVVYMAQQSAPVRRKVALKIIKPGMDTKEVIARFEAERQALAMMDHPNIARVLDAGTTDSGRPFFVMELVQGLEITEFCDSNSLSTKERLALFGKVCRAVQHAHQKGIIHRDIKPSNILVTLHDGEPVPKVIDFGVSEGARLPVDRKDDVHSLWADDRTPAYMSSRTGGNEWFGSGYQERRVFAGCSALRVAGRTSALRSRRTERWRTGTGMRQMIRETEPPSPSHLVRTLDFATASTVANHRAIKPEALTRLLRGELDWIVMRSLEKDRNRRYQSVTEFADDVERYLSGEAVKASPPSWSYRTRKAMWKHRNPVAIAATFFLTLVVGLAVSASGWQREINLREEIEVERNNAVAAKQEAERASQQEADARDNAEENAKRAQESLDLVLAAISSAGRDPSTGAEYPISEAIGRLSDALDEKKGLSEEAVARIHHAIAIAYLNAGKLDKASLHFQALLQSRQVDDYRKAEGAALHRLSG